MDSAQIDLLEVLRSQFGLDAFRPGQERIIRALLAGRDVLAVMPTGAGKSLLYQLAAQVLPGVTVVVSPLLALMKDQVESLEAHGLEVGMINSTLSAGEARASLAQVQQGHAKLLYVTPERFDNEAFMQELCALDLSLLVVDEAHCISDWGHAFRPAYLTLGQAIKQCRQPTVLALTATATPWVRQDIVERLSLRRPEIVVHGTDRPNLFFEVRRVESEDDDKRVLHELLLPADGDQSSSEESEAALLHELHGAMQGSGIIYTATTRAARETAEWLRDWGIAADYYHGQRKKADRERVQNGFMDGSIRVIAATNAFGLGVDKPDVRFVIHRDIPASVEAYYQEAGRAGRDGAFARCTIIYRPADLGRAAFLAGGGQLTREEVIQARAGLLAQPKATRRELEAATGLGKGDLARLITVLKSDKIVAERRGRVHVLVDDFDPEQVSLETEERRLAYEHSRLEMMRGYAETGECRRRYLLNYFGEESDHERCDRCDNDRASSAEQRVVIQAVEAYPSPFAMGMRVEHVVWGCGVVQRVTADSLTVLFDSVGYKTLAIDVVQEQGLLHAA